jgi:DNA-binding IclR family transcriptional regulator
MAPRKAAQSEQAAKGRAETGKPRGIQSATVALSVLRVLIESGQPLFLREVAAGAGIAASNAYRYLVSFAEAGMIVQDPLSGKYDLGPLAIQLGLSALQRVDAVDIAIEVLSDLVLATRADGHICVFGTAGPTVIRWKQGPGDISLRVGEGLVLPVLGSATGRLWAAFLPPEIAMMPMSGRQPSRSGARAAQPTLAKNLSALTDPILETGISQSSGELKDGIDVICAPIFDRDGKIILSITLLGTSANFSARADQIVPELQSAVVSISKRIGCGPAALSKYPWVPGKAGSP